MRTVLETDYGGGLYRRRKAIVEPVFAQTKHNRRIDSWPSMDGWGELKALMYWAPGGYSETRSRFVRDPFNLAGGADSTCTEDSPASPGAQFRAKAYGIFVHVGTPLARMVRHNAPSPVALTHAQFKLAIHEVQ
jgi:hypothetical protein